MSEPVDIDQLAAEIIDSPKYAHIHPGLVRRLAAQELAKGRSRKDALKSVRSKLHQVGGAYQEKPIDYHNWLGRLNTLPGDITDPRVLTFCREMMETHASTRERLAYLDSFYEMVFSKIGQVNSILDLACGLHPLSLPWFKIAGDLRVQACDIYSNLVSFLNVFFEHFGINGQASLCDLTSGEYPRDHFQLALLLKTIPCLEQVDKSIGRKLLENLDADHALVTFPASSLGGREKGMRTFYHQHFLSLVQGLPWQVELLDHPAELAFLLHHT